MKKHTVRIVGGDYRRTPIRVTDAPFLRPTPDRVRETLFNWLHHLWSGQFADKHILDLFAGTGALGFEAASRKVAYVHMVEHHPAAVRALQSLRNKLQATHIHIKTGDAIAELRQLPAHRFDLILLDPPFGQNWLEQIWPLLPHALAPDGLVYIECEVPPHLPETLEPVRQGRAGKVHFMLAKQQPAAIAASPD